MSNRVVGRVALFLAVAQLVVVMLSWLLSAWFGSSLPHSSVTIRSMLSSEGIRWFLGSFTQIIQSPLLVWMLLLSMSGGAVMGSGLLSGGRRGIGIGFAWRMTIAVAVAYLLVVAALTLLPHAILLSATGQLFPSPFSRSIVPIVAFGLLLVSMVYGLLTRTFVSVGDILHAMSDGIAACAPLFILYILAAQLFHSVKYVLM